MCSYITFPIETRWFNMYVCTCGAVLCVVAFTAMHPKLSIGIDFGHAEVCANASLLFVHGIF